MNSEHRTEERQSPKVNGEAFLPPWMKHLKGRRMSARAERRVSENMGWVVNEAKRLSRAFNVEMEDLMQEGLLGLVVADGRFKEGYGSNVEHQGTQPGRTAPQRRPTPTFLCYAKFWVKNHMQRWLERNSSDVRIPAERFHGWKQPALRFTYLGFDEPVGQRDGASLTLAEVLPAPNGVPGHELEESDDLRAVLEAMEGLSYRESEVLRGVFLRGESQVEVARCLGVTHQAASLAQRRALKKVRSRLLKMERPNLKRSPSPRPSPPGEGVGNAGKKERTL